MDKLNEIIIKLSGVPLANSPAEQFMKGLADLSSNHPINPLKVVIDNCSVQASPCEGNTKIHISDMASSTKGSGTKALTKLCELADQVSVPLRLVAKGYADTPTEKLVEWYTRYGFVKSGFGSNDDGWRMERAPKTIIKLSGFKSRPH